MRIRLGEGQLCHQVEGVRIRLGEGNFVTRWRVGGLGWGRGYFVFEFYPVEHENR